ncbi:uncharacterized protein TNCV_936401 [Trichonephila clavipes]|nr:uncharacterized protein TNCV_936401 [Trichonephila clavipes]
MNCPKVLHQSPDRIASLASSLSGTFTDRKHVVHGYSMIDPEYTPAATPGQLWQPVEAAWSAVPQEHMQSLFESMPRRVAAVISNNGGYSGYCFCSQRLIEDETFNDSDIINNLINYEDGQEARFFESG